MGHGRKPTGRAWVSAAVMRGSWAPSPWGPLAKCGSWLKSGPPGGMRELGYLSTTSFPSQVECCPWGPLTPWHPGLFLLQKQAWERAAQVLSVLGWGGRGGIREGHQHGCLSPPPERGPSWQGPRGYWKYFHSGRIQGGLSRGGAAWLENPFHWAHIVLLQASTLCSRSASWKRKGSSHIFRTSLASDPETPVCLLTYTGARP